ncbi:MAG: hypothetical protein H6722_32165 [Sandaracinus sp.]|nr:hypothetical protein [Sandaracinus sp.]
MYLGKNTSFLGTQWPCPLKTGVYPIKKKDVRTLVQRTAFEPEIKCHWSLKKNTEVVVVGEGADEAQVAEAKERGLIVEDFPTWLGMGLVPGAKTVGDWLRGLHELGFCFNELSNEADGSIEVITLPVVPLEVTQHLGPGHLELLRGHTPHGGKLSPASDALIAAHNAIAGWVKEHRLDRLTSANPLPPDNFGLQSLASGTADDPPKYWVNRFGGLRNVVVQSEGRVLPDRTVEAKTQELGEPYHDVSMNLLDSRSLESVRICKIIGALEKGGAEVSFTVLDVVHT